MPKKGRELLELKVSAVALVDEPANLRPFFIVKRIDKPGPPSAADLQEEAVKKKPAKKAVKKDEAGDDKVEKQAVVVSEEDLGTVNEALTSVAELATSFAATVAAKTPQDGMVVFTEEDLTAWEEFSALATSIGAMLAGAPDPNADAGDVDAGEEGAEDETRMAKFEERMGDIEEAVLLLIQSSQGGVEKVDSESDVIDEPALGDDALIQ